MLVGRLSPLATFSNAKLLSLMIGSPYATVRGANMQQKRPKLTVRDNPNQKNKFIQKYKKYRYLSYMDITEIKFISFCFNFHEMWNCLYESRFWTNLFRFL